MHVEYLVERKEETKFLKGKRNKIWTKLSTHWSMMERDGWLWSNAAGEDRRDQLQPAHRCRGKRCSDSERTATIGIHCSCELFHPVRLPHGGTGTFLIQRSEGYFPSRAGGRACVRGREGIDVKRRRRFRGLLVISLLFLVGFIVIRFLLL